MAVAAPARVVVPVAASAGVGSVLGGDPAEGRLLGAGARGAWARVGEEVVALTPPGAVRFPNGVAAPQHLLGALAGGEVCSVGGGSLDLGRWRLRVVRWWDPRPALPRVDPGLLRERVAVARDSFHPAEDAGLGAALAAMDPGVVLTAAQRLIGNGPGLTPLGDDVLAGAVAAAVLLGEAADRPSLRRMVAGLAPALCAATRERTTALAASLLRHAFGGEVDDASAGLLRALGGTGDPGAALEALLGVGHSSGTGLATGLLAGAAAAGGPP